MKASMEDLTAALREDARASFVELVVTVMAIGVLAIRLWRARRCETSPVPDYLN